MWCSLIKLNRRIIIAFITISLMFLALVSYVSYFALLRMDDIASDPNDRRKWSYDSLVLRGNIFDKNGTLLAYTESSGDEYNGKLRVYPFGSLYSHVIGYNSVIYGKSLLEKSFDNLLNGRNSIDVSLNVPPSSDRGYDLNLTIDHNLQLLAYNRLGNRNGAVVALDPRDGAVLAMVSKPDFNPNHDELEGNWENLIADEASPLFPRATQGLYPPGSVFKIISSAAVISENLDTVKFDDKGKVDIDGRVFTNYSNLPMGRLDLNKAFCLSSNCMYAALCSGIDASVLRNYALKFGFEKSMNFDFNIAVSKYPEKNMDKADKAAASIGQWEVLATPMQMAVAASVVANGGLSVEPYIVGSAVDSVTGSIVYENKSYRGTPVISSEISSKIKSMMVEAVKTGTAKNAALPGISVAGKTGTAENENKLKNHAWFTAFAPAENPEIAVSVLLEYSGGTGGSLAAPIAREIIKKYLDSK